MKVSIKNSSPFFLASIFFIFFATLGLLLRIVNIENPLNDWDESTYVLIAHGLIQGELPYNSAYDHKPIALYYIYALFFEVLGYNLTTLRLIPFVSIALTTWMLYKVAKTHLPPSRYFAAFAALLFMATCTSFGNSGHSSNTEILQMPVFAAWWLAALNQPESSWRRSLLMGAMAGLNAQINYLGGFILSVSTAILVAWPLFGSFSFAEFKLFILRGALSLGAFAAVSFLMILPLIVAGEWQQYFWMQRSLLSGYDSTISADKIFRAAISTGASAGFFIFLLAAMCWKNGKMCELPVSSVGKLLQFAAVFAVTLIAIAMTKRLYPHYFNLLIPTSSLILVFLLGSASEKSLKRFAIPSVVLAVMLITRGAWDVFLKDWKEGFRQQQEYAQLEEKIRTQAKPNERVLLLNLNTMLYFTSEVRPATRFVFRGQIFEHHFLSRIGSNPALEVKRALETQPVLVLACFDEIAAPYVKPVTEMLSGKYREEMLPRHVDCRDLRAYYPSKQS